jgi:hypothetical protein
MVCESSLGIIEKSNDRSHFCNAARGVAAARWEIYVPPSYSMINVNIGIKYLMLNLRWANLVIQKNLAQKI